MCLQSSPPGTRLLTVMYVERFFCIINPVPSRWWTTNKRRAAKRWAMTLVVGMATGLIAVFVTFCTKALYNLKLTPVYTALHVAGGLSVFACLTHSLLLRRVVALLLLFFSSRVLFARCARWLGDFCNEES